MNQLRYSLFVLLGACSYGMQASVIKLATNAGYYSEQVIGSQFVFGGLALAVLLLFAKRIKLSYKQLLSLLGVGIFVSLTGIFYAASVAQLPASIAIVLLFQFTWIGILIEAIYTRTLPSKLKCISIIFLWIGTLLAGGIASAQMNWISETKGVIAGLFSALSFALFIFFSGKAAKGVPSIQRSFVITIGGVIVSLLFASPAFLIDGTMTGGLWKYGLLVGLFGVVIPIVFFAIGTPHIDSGTATILGAAELPAAIIGAMFILGEWIHLSQIIGVILILIGIIIPQMRLKKRVTPKPISDR